MEASRYHPPYAVAHSNPGHTFEPRTPGQEQRISALHTRLVQGSYLAAQQPKGVVIGEKLANTIDATVGSEIILMTQAVDGSMGNDLYTVVGIFHTGLEALDRGLVLMPLSSLQELLSLASQRVHEVGLLLSDAAEDFTRARLMLEGDIGAQVSWTVHYEHFGVIDSAGGTTSGLFAGGHSTDTQRLSLLPLDWTVKKANSLLWRHELDRLSLRFSLPAADIVIGRQAISWGVGRIWTPADLFVAFSPVEIDREFKPGVDAVSVKWPLGSFSQFEAVYAAFDDDFRFSNGLYALLEYYFNGVGERDTEDYRRLFGSERLRRGEIFNFGRHYLGATLAYEPHPLVNVNLVGLWNLLDQSLLIGPLLAVSLSNEADVRAGAYFPVGPGFVGPHIHSEFGLYPHVYYLELRLYF